MPKENCTKCNYVCVKDGWQMYTYYYYGLLAKIYVLPNIPYCSHNGSIHFFTAI